MHITEAQVQDLVDLGRRKGVLTTEDIRRVLPIEGMSPDDLASVMARLEEANIPVEIDPALHRPGPRPHAMPDTAPARLHPVEPKGPAVGVDSATILNASALPAEEGRARTAGQRYGQVRPILPAVVTIALILLVIALWWYWS